MPRSKRLKREAMPQKLLSFREVCRQAGVKYEDGKRLVEEIVASTDRGYLVNVSGFGRFWVQKMAARTILMPTAPGQTTTTPVHTDGNRRLRFRMASTLVRVLKKRAKGRGKGTE